MIDQITFKDEGEAPGGQPVGFLIIDEKRSKGFFSQAQAEDLAELFDVELVIDA